VVTDAREWSAAQILHHILMLQTATNKVIRKSIRWSVGTLARYRRDDSVFAPKLPKPGRAYQATELVWLEDLPVKGDLVRFAREIGSRFRLFIGLSLLLLPFAKHCLADDNTSISRAASIVKSDFENFYLARENLIPLGIGLSVGAVFANTHADREIRDWYQEDVRSKRTDDAAKIFKSYGTAYVTVPVYAVAYGAGRMMNTPTFETWGERSFRATVVGTPALLFLQVAIGAERPPGDSGWKPFHSSHGASGHAFIGSVPFVTAAQMSDEIYWKAAFYGLSTLTGWSRINDDAHYFSQAGLGWFLGYLSCTVVTKTDALRQDRIHFGFAPVPRGGTITFQMDL
jgi:PAP2 superfamily